MLPAAWLMILACAAAGLAQAPEVFKGRLSPVPIDAKMAPDIAGHGAASATLAGNKLTVSGTFEGMRGSATAAQLRRGSATGVPGAAVFDLMVTNAPNGTISGSFDLTADQADALRKGRFYVQIDSEKGSDGNLWGWLLK